MTTCVKNCLWFVPALGLSLSLCQAQAPSGQISFSFNANNAPVYDLTGTYTIAQDILGAAGATVPLTVYDMPFVQDAQGRLQGLGTILVGVGSDFVAADYTARGRVSGGGNSPIRVNLNVALKGEDVVAGLDTHFNVSIRYNLEVSPDGMMGTARGSARFTKLAGGSIRADDVVVPLPAGVDGSWTAQMNIVPFKTLAGSGAFVLSNGRLLPARLSGTFSESLGIAKARLSGIFDGRGNSLSLEFVTGASQPNRAQGKILGQTVRE